MEQATFGAGCFWSVEAAFRRIPGVSRTSVGYMGGHFERPCHWDVVARITGHAEVAQVEFEPQIVSYEQLLAVFWKIHDPTSLNRQGADRGEQYRSMIFCHTPEQMAIARRSKQALDASGDYDKPIVTEIQSASDYWLANDEHQQYLEKKSRGIGG
ncbi:MAG: peptide-methionine (S)-S-oxide reductase MsrA [Alkalinema sp. RU_4_3]|nr:peptide-methionine (S)-S-oxide reductase MsrA [Alkalinema sp. RU_4_3]